MMGSVYRLALPLLALLASACAESRLHASFGSSYNAVFNAQFAERSGRDAAPMRGEEVRRIVQRYYSTFAPDDAASGGGGGGGGGGVSLGATSPAGFVGTYNDWKKATGTR